MQLQSPTTSYLTAKRLRPLDKIINNTARQYKMTEASFRSGTFGTETGGFVNNLYSLLAVCYRTDEPFNDWGGVGDVTKLSLFWDRTARK